MSQLITDINDIKIYYPFLMDRISVVRYHQRDILSFLLLSDKVILSPDHIFNKNVVKNNASFLKENDLFFQLFKHGQIITTSTDNKIGSYKDIIEQRSKLTNINIPNFSIPIYMRNGELQSNLYKKFFLKNFSKAEAIFYDKDKITEFISFVSYNQEHNKIISKLNSINFKKKIDIQGANYAKKLAEITYLNVGAKGNNAIMPTYNFGNQYSFFNDYYSLRFSRLFADRISKLIKQDIVDLPYEKFIQISNSLKVFKDYYNENTIILKNLEDEVFNILNSVNDDYQFIEIKKGIKKIVFTAIGELIEDHIIPLFKLKYINEFLLKISLSNGIEKINLYDKLYDYFEKNSTYYYSYKVKQDALSFFNRFDKAVSLTKDE